MLRRLAVVVLALCAVVMLVGTAFAFTDVDAGHPYSAAVSDLSARGVVSGYADGSFRPENPMLRAQFAKMIVGALKIDPNSGGESPFTDLGPALSSDGYPVRYVAAAYANGITEGRTPTHFFPYFEVSRAQAITMIMRATQRLDVADLAAPPSGYPSTLGEFSRMHGASAAVAEYNGLLAGLQGFERGWDRVRWGFSDGRERGRRPVPQPVRPHVGWASQLFQLRYGRPDDAGYAGRR